MPIRELALYVLLAAKKHERAARCLRATRPGSAIKDNSGTRFRFFETPDGATVAPVGGGGGAAAA